MAAPKQLPLLLVATLALVLALHGSTIPSVVGFAEMPSATAALPQCSDSLVFLNEADGTFSGQIAAPLRHNTTGHLSTSSSAYAINVTWTTGAFTGYIDGFPNWVVNLTDFHQTYLGVGFMPEAEFLSTYDGATACGEPDRAIAVLTQRMLKFSTGDNVSQCIFSMFPDEVGIVPCKPFTVYAFGLAMKLTQVGNAPPQLDNMYWAGTSWVQAHDPSDPVCPNSPTSWAYTKLTVWWCPCDSPLSPPPPPSVAPPLPQPTCSDKHYLLSRDGEYTDMIAAPGFEGWASRLVVPNSVITTKVDGPLRYNQSVVPGQPSWSFEWSQEYLAQAFLALLNEKQFHMLYSGSTPPTKCKSPTDLIPADKVLAVPKKTSAIGLLDPAFGWFNVLEALQESPCKPVPVYLLAAIQDALGFRATVYPAADWMQAYSSAGGALCDSITNWGYTRFEITYCPCSPQIRPPPPLPPLPPPPSPGNNDALVASFPFSATCKARKISLTPYRVSSLMGPFNATSAFATYCFVASAKAPVVGGGSCAGMQVNKVEFIIKQACVAESPKAVRAITANGKTVSAWYDIKTFNGELYGVMAISQLADKFPAVPAGGLRVCLKMSKTSTCGSPAGLCYGGSCVYALFNKDRTCCPTSQVPF